MKELLAYWLELRNLAHTAHVNVRGGHFFSLHHVFEDMYKKALDNADIIAERIKQIDLSEQVEMSAPSLSSSYISEAEEWVVIILDKLAQLNSLQGEIWSRTMGDYVTNDIMIRLSTQTEMWRWQLTAFIS